MIDAAVSSLVDGKLGAGEERFHDHPCLRPGQIDDLVFLLEVFRDVVLVQNLKNTFFHVSLR